MDGRASGPDSRTHRRADRALRECNLGDAKALGAGILEARFTLGPGYRLYFGIHRGELILLLLGGDKSTQRSDIATAKRYWSEFLEVEYGKA